MNKYRNSPTILFPEFIAFFIVYIIYHVYNAWKYNLPSTGRWWNISNSVFFTEQGSLRYFTCLIVLLRALAADLIPVNISMTTFFCKMIGVSPAVINSFSTMSSFTTALLFYILYKERLNKQHVIGMLLIVASVLIVAVCKTIQMTSSQVSDEKDILLTALDQDDETSSEKFIGSKTDDKHSPLMILVPICFVTFSVFLLTMGSWTSRAARGIKYVPN